MLNKKRYQKFIATGKDLEGLDRMKALFNAPVLPKFTFTEEEIRTAIDGLNVSKLRDISMYFYYASKAYGRLVDYFANMLTFDYLIIPKQPQKNRTVANEKVQEELLKVLRVFKKSRFKQENRNIASVVMIEGVFFGYLIYNKDNFEIQELPYKYCATNFEYMGVSIIEFNLEYFDREFNTKEERDLMLEIYPDDIAKAYQDYKNGGPKIFYVEPKNSMVFSLNENFIPYLVSIVLDIIRFNNYKAIDEIRNEQEILKLIIQKLPVAKDGTLLFSPKEMEYLHTIVADMLEEMPSIDLITSYAEIKSENLQDQKNSMQNSMANAKNNVYSEAGVSEQIMDAEGNIALDKSIKTDEGVMFNLLEAIKNYFQFVLDTEFSNKKLSYSLIMPELTIYNRQEWFDRYLKGAQFGYSKLLVVLSMGIGQEDFYDLMNYENEILEIVDRLIPLQSSHTESAEESGGKGGAPEKKDENKDDKTITNRNND